MPFSGLNAWKSPHVFSSGEPRMTSQDLHALLHVLADYAADRRGNDGRRPQRPTDSYESQLAKFALGELDETLSVEGTIKDLILSLIHI